MFACFYRNFIFQKVQLWKCSIDTFLPCAYKIVPIFIRYSALYLCIKVSDIFYLDLDTRMYVIFQTVKVTNNKNRHPVITILSIDTFYVIIKNVTFSINKTFCVYVFKTWAFFACYCENGISQKVGDQWQNWDINLWNFDAILNRSFALNFMY